MKKLYIRYTIYIILFIVIIYGFKRLDIEHLIYPTTNITNDKKLDSLNNIIKDNDLIIKQKDLKIDSLQGRKLNIIKTYETTIQNYYNPSIVSDDSISNYISKELQNW